MYSMLIIFNKRKIWRQNREEISKNKEQKIQKKAFEYWMSRYLHLTCAAKLY